MLNKQNEARAKRDVAIAVQVDHLTSTVHSFRDQLGTNADFAVDAMQQMRSETGAKLKAMEQTFMAALNAGGDRHSSSQPATATESEATKLGRPDAKDESTNEPYAIQCSYCLGSVPKSSQSTAETVTCTFTLGTCKSTGMNGLVPWSITTCARGAQNTSRSMTTS